MSNGTLKTSDIRENILAFVSDCQDNDVKVIQRTLTRNVPYRLQSPFLEKVKHKEWDVLGKLLPDKINQEKRLIYYFTSICGMQSIIYSNAMDGLYNFESRNLKRMNRV